MTEEAFRELFRKLLEHYRMPPETAVALLERILVALGDEPSGTAAGPPIE